MRSFDFLTPVFYYVVRGISEKLWPSSSSDGLGIAGKR
jgi:hypothetical protein